MMPRLSPSSQWGSGWKSKCGGFALDVLDHVGAFVGAGRHVVEWDVWQAEEEGVDLGFQGADDLF